MNAQPNGQIITFYSYKGGTGRTMALANTACVLAAREMEVGGKGVLMIDWDLEAPGLHRYFRPGHRSGRRRRSPEAQQWMQPGLIDLFHDVATRIENTIATDEAATGTRDRSSPGTETHARAVLASIDMQDYVRSTDVPGLSLMPAGQFDPERSNAYSERVNTFDWEKLYEKSPHLIRVFAEVLAERYAYVLIDSRTGVTDISGICTMLLPEKLVVVFTPNLQSTAGALNLIREATAYRKESPDLRPLLVFPLVSRVDATVSDLRELWRHGSDDEDVAGYQPEFERVLAEIYGRERIDLGRYFDEIQIQHSPLYAYGERIAALTEKTEDRFSLKRSYRTFADYLVRARTPWQLEGDTTPRPAERLSAAEASRLAIERIGAGAAGDYLIEPSRHADAYASVPELAAILRSSVVQSTARQYERLDGEAVVVQRQFKRLSARANITVLLTAVLAALTLATGTAGALLSPAIVDMSLIGLGVASVVTGALASRDLLIIKQGHVLEKWMGKRALAEAARLEYFERVTSADAAPPTDGTVPTGAPLPLLQLEYFRRYQLDVQCAFFDRRGQDHRTFAARTLALGSWSVAGAAAATGAAGLLGAFVHPGFAALGAAGAILTGLSSFAATREAIGQDRRNAERYERTFHVLEDLGKRLDDVRAAIFATGTTPLEDFVDAVHEQLALEHRQWLGAFAETRGAFARLDETLKPTAAKLPAKP